MRKLRNLLIFSLLCGAGKYLTSWPDGCDPVQVGRGITQRFIDKGKPEITTKKGMTYVKYTITSEWANCLEFARIIADKDMENALIAMFEPFYDSGEKAAFRSHKWHVDYSVFGAVPLQIYCLNSDPRALALGLDYADNQWSEPSSDPADWSLTKVPYEKQLEWLSQGYSPQTRLWIDDMYMITFLQLQAYRATGDSSWMTRIPGKPASRRLPAHRMPGADFLQAEIISRELLREFPLRRSAVVQDHP